MQPSLILTPFAQNAASGNVDKIPNSLGPDDPPQAASWQIGFPQVTMTPLAAGGIPPRGQSFNGVLKALSEHTVFVGGGGNYRWDNKYASQIGYSKGATVLMASGSGFWMSTVDGNTSDPDSGGSNWIPIVQSGIEILNSSGSFLVPAGVNNIYLSGCGGGAGGGGTFNIGATGNVSAGGGGGGAGWFVLRQRVIVTPGQIIPYDVGAGGAGGAISSKGGNGGSSRFGSIALAGGSGGGAGGAGVSSNSWPGGVGGLGYSSGGDASDVIGSYGAISGAGGNSPFGSGGCPARSAVNNSLAGKPASGFGAGGSGAGGAYIGSAISSGNTGGAGAPGVLILEW